MAIKKRNIVTCILLSIITCGIYGIYWLIVMTSEAVKVKDPADSGILEIVLMLFLPFLGFFLAKFLGLGTMAITIFGAIIAFIIYLFGEKKEKEVA